MHQKGNIATARFPFHFFHLIRQHPRLLGHPDIVLVAQHKIIRPGQTPQMGQLAFCHLILWQQAPMLRLLLRTMGCIRHQLKELQEMDSCSSGRLLP